MTILYNTVDSIIATCNLMPEVFRDGIILCDASKKTLHVSEKVCLFTGYTPEEFISKNIFISDNSPLFQKDTVQYATSIRSKQGDMIPIIIYPKCIELQHQSFFLFILQKQMELHVPLKSYFLAQFPNRFLFLHEMLRHAMTHCYENNTYGALLLLDIDNFKSVNHIKGYALGDQVLIDIAKRISLVVNILSIEHLNGDEFAIVTRTQSSLYQDAEKEVSHLCEKILNAISEPILIENQSFLLTASIGVVPFLGQEYTPEKLIQYADGALFEAKRHGRNSTFFFSPLIQHIREEKAILLERLQYAIQHEHMSIFYQKQWKCAIKNDEMCVIGVEALVRWNDPLHGLITPDKFIPSAEESGCIIPLGTWILHEALKQLKIWENDAIKRHWQLSINISIKQFERDDFIAIVQNLIHQTACRPHKIRFELTESLLIQDLKTSLKKVQNLTQMGISLSIDDFGTGYSSLSYLRQLPIQELKIDKSFVKDMVKNNTDGILVQTILGIGKRFGLDVVAEGVETKEQYEMLCDMGCTHFQGYFFSKPMEEVLL